MKFIAKALFFILLSCKAQDKGLAFQGLHDTKFQENSHLTLLICDDYSGLETPENFVIKEGKRLKSFFNGINKTRKPGLPVPEVDFSQEMILIFCAGAQDAHVRPYIEFIEENETEMIYSVNLDLSKIKTTDTAIITPFCAYKIPWTSKQITFKITV